MAVNPAPLPDRDRAQVGPRQLKEPGSPDWCWQTVYYLKDCMRHVGEEWRQAEQVLEDLVKVRAWEKIPLGQPYGSLDKMLKAEIGLPAQEIRALIRRAELAAYPTKQDPATGQFVRSVHGDNVTMDSGNRGNARITLSAAFVATATSTWPTRWSAGKSPPTRRPSRLASVAVQ